MSPSYLIRIGGKTFIREALPAAVMTTPAGTKALVMGVKFATDDDPRSESENRLREALEQLFADLLPEMAARLAKGEMPSDQELADAFARVIQPELVEAATREFERLGVEVGVQFDPAIASQQAIDFARTYTYDLVKNLTDTTRKTLQSALAEFQATPGMTRAQLEALIAPTFGPVRAEAIAITEITRSAMAAMDAYSAKLSEAGIKTELVFHTAHDERVCVVCSPDNGKPQSKWGDRGKPPRHSRCRCFCTLRFVEEA